MKYQIHNNTNTKRKQQKVPAITFYKSGGVLINGAAVAALGNPNAVEFMQDTERPQDWYVRAADAENGFVLKGSPKIKGLYKTFNRSALTHKVLAALQHTGASVQCPLAQEPTAIDGNNWHAILTAAS